MKKESYKKRKKEGICTRCSNKAEEGKTKCTEHYARDRELSKIRTEKRKTQGCCSKCGKQLSATDGIHCFSCNEKGRIEYKNITEQQRKRKNERHRLLAKQKKEKGGCIVCGAERATASMCAKHREIQRKASEILYRKRKEQSLCAWCGIPLQYGRMCDKHVKEGRKQNKKMYERMKKDNKCCKCQNPLHPEMDAGKVVCLTCRTKRRLFYPERIRHK